MLSVAISYILLQMSIVDSLPDLASYIGTSPRFSASLIIVFRIADNASPSLSLR